MENSQPIISEMISNNKDTSNDSFEDDATKTTILNTSNKVDIDDIKDSNAQDSDNDMKVGNSDNSEEEFDSDNSEEELNNDNSEEELDSDNSEEELDGNDVTDNDADNDLDEKTGTLLNPISKIKDTQVFTSDDDDDDDSDDDYLQKFEQEIHKNFINDYHPEALTHNYEEVLTLSKIIKSESGEILDPLHRTLPILSKYEKTRIIGQRAKQLESGAKPFIDIPDAMNRSITIAEMELKAKKIPFIIRRPLPNNGFEYWKIEDLEII